MFEGVDQRSELFMMFVILSILLENEENEKKRGERTHIDTRFQIKKNQVGNFPPNYFKQCHVGKQYSRLASL
jgi:hypothetical protein